MIWTKAPNDRNWYNRGFTFGVTREGSRRFFSFHLGLVQTSQVCADLLLGNRESGKGLPEKCVKWQVLPEMQDYGGSWLHSNAEVSLSCVACMGNLSKRETNLVGTVGQEGVTHELVTFLVTLPGKPRDPAWPPSLLSNQHLASSDVLLQRQREEEEGDGEERDGKSGERDVARLPPVSVSSQLLPWPQLPELPQMATESGLVWATDP